MKQRIKKVSFSVPRFWSLLSHGGSDLYFQGWDVPGDTPLSIRGEQVRRLKSQEVNNHYDSTSQIARGRLHTLMGKAKYLRKKFV